MEHPVSLHFLLSTIKTQGKYFVFREAIMVFLMKGSIRFSSSASNFLVGKGCTKPILVEQLQGACILLFVYSLGPTMLTIVQTVHCCFPWSVGYDLLIFHFNGFDMLKVLFWIKIRLVSACSKKLRNHLMSVFLSKFLMSQSCIFLNVFFSLDFHFMFIWCMGTDLPLI